MTTLSLHFLVPGVELLRIGGWSWAILVAYLPRTR